MHNATRYGRLSSPHPKQSCAATPTINLVRSSLKFLYSSQNLKTRRAAVLVVLGNKADLVDSMMVTSAQGAEFARSVDAVFFESSAKDNRGAGAFSFGRRGSGEYVTTRTELPRTTGQGSRKRF